MIPIAHDMTRAFRKGLHRVGTTDHQRAIANTDRAVSLMTRERDAALRCVLFEANHCNPKNQMECGHFIERERMATRYHPYNVNKECSSCNSSHVSGYRPDKGFPYSLAIDEKYGEGTAKFLYRLAHPLHEIGKPAPDDGWTVVELGTLADAARRGARVYEAVYFELRPTNRPIEVPSEGRDASPA